MKKTFLVLLFSLFVVQIFSQEEAPAERSSKPVRFTFGTSILIDNQTVATPFKGSIELEIHHRFSLIESYHNLFGIYGTANTRIGLNYGITDKIMVGLGTTKDYKLQDIQWKYLILQQTQDNHMPVSLSYYGNMVFDLRNKSDFGKGEYRTIHRLSYFTQLILARKLNDMFSVQVAPSMAYLNSVPQYIDVNDTTVMKGYKNMNFGLSIGARANVFGNHSVIFEYDQLLTKQNIDVQPKPNLALGWEIGTATHTFQIFVANFPNIINQHNLVFNTNEFSKGDYLVGFNVTVRF